MINFKYGFQLVLSSPFFCISQLCIIKEKRHSDYPRKGKLWRKKKNSSEGLSLPAVCKASYEMFGTVREGGISGLLLLPVFQLSVVPLFSFQGYLAARCGVLLSVITSVLQFTIALCQPVIWTWHAHTHTQRDTHTYILQHIHCILWTAPS